MKSNDIPIWEVLQKKIVWNQLNFVHNKKVLDFGSGEGITASHFAINNEVVAVEPDDSSILKRVTENKYTF